MDPLTTAVATVVTRFVVEGGSKIATELGERASQAAAALAQKVLDRLGSDPSKAPTVDEYKAEPQRTQPALEASLAELVAADKQFAEQLAALLAEYDPKAAEAAGVTVGGDATGPIQVGNDNVQIGSSSGTITFNRGDRGAG
jgi:hypothetical protein